jgi:hypothetical protein
MAPKDNRVWKRLRDVQCRPSILRRPLHELAFSEQGKYEEKRKKELKEGDERGAL